MTSALLYDDLDSNRVDSAFDEKGELLVSLPPNHGKSMGSDSIDLI